MNKLSSYLENKNLSYSAFGRMIGVDRSNVRRYALSQRVPERDVMHRIYEATGGEVDANSFYGLNGGEA